MAALNPPDPILIDPLPADPALVDPIWAGPDSGTPTADGLKSGARILSAPFARNPEPVRCAAATEFSVHGPASARKMGGAALPASGQAVA